MDVLWGRYSQRKTERHWVYKTIVGKNRDRFVNGDIKTGFGDFALGEILKIDATDFCKIDYDKLFVIVKQFITR